MATVTGILQDYENQPFYGKNPVMEFVPSGPGVEVDSSNVFGSYVRQVVPAADGGFAVSLQPTTTLHPEVWYSVRLRWSRGGDGPAAFDEFPGRLYVPPEGGLFADLMQIRSNPASMVWVSESEYLNASPLTLWYHPETGELKVRN